MARKVILIVFIGVLIACSNAMEEKDISRQPKSLEGIKAKVDNHIKVHEEMKKYIEDKSCDIHQELDEDMESVVHYLETAAEKQKKWENEKFGQEIVDAIINEVSTPKNMCCICIDELKLTSPELFTAECNHSFHKDCIKNWTDIRKKCPLCQKDIEPPKSVNTGLDDLQKLLKESEEITNFDKEVDVTFQRKAEFIEFTIKFLNNVREKLCNEIEGGKDADLKVNELGDVSHQSDELAELMATIDTHIKKYENVEKHILDYHDQFFHMFIISKKVGQQIEASLNESGLSISEGSEAINSENIDNKAKHGRSLEGTAILIEFGIKALEIIKKNVSGELEKGASSDLALAMYEIDINFPYVPIEDNLAEIMSDIDILVRRYEGKEFSDNEIDVDYIHSVMIKTFKDFHTYMLVNEENNPEVLVKMHEILFDDDKDFFDDMKDANPTGNFSQKEALKKEKIIQGLIKCLKAAKKAVEDSVPENLYEKIEGEDDTELKTDELGDKN